MPRHDRCLSLPCLMMSPDVFCRQPDYVDPMPPPFRLPDIIRPYYSIFSDYWFPRLSPADAATIDADIFLMLIVFITPPILFYYVLSSLILHATITDTNIHYFRLLPFHFITPFILLLTPDIFMPLFITMFVTILTMPLLSAYEAQSKTYKRYKKDEASASAAWGKMRKKDDATMARQMRRAARSRVCAAIWCR